MARYRGMAARAGEDVAESAKADPAKVADRLRTLCSKREYCRADIIRKASEAMGGDREAGERIADRLAEEKYVDDMRYASAFARDKASISGWGIVKIRHALAAKGVAPDVVDAAVGEIDRTGAGLRLRKLMENRYRSLSGDPQCRMKMLRFAMGRGYGYGEASEVIDMLMGSDEDM